MYKNIGKKVKIFAEIIGWLGLIGGLFAALVLLEDEWLRRVAWIPLVVGLSLYLFSLPLFCTGQIVDDLHTLRNIAEKDTVSGSEELPSL